VIWVRVVGIAWPPSLTTYLGTILWRRDDFRKH
jgi:hypothetical protein